jgi:hypothetical protein
MRQKQNELTIEKAAKIANNYAWFRDRSRYGYHFPADMREFLENYERQYGPVKWRRWENTDPLDGLQGVGQPLPVTGANRL